MIASAIPPGSPKSPRGCVKKVDAERRGALGDDGAEDDAEHRHGGGGA